MKFIFITYIKSPQNIETVEAVLDYHGFGIIESNNNYRVFTGHFNGNAGKLADRLNNELENIEFDVEDSMFIVYPVIKANGNASTSNLIIKRKGNRVLRNKMIT